MSRSICRTTFILTLALMLCTVVAVADESRGENLAWSLQDGILMITGTGSMTDYDEDQTTPWKESRETIRTIILSEGITRIGTYAFADCSQLVSVHIPETVEQIGAHAFENCDCLETVTFPDGLKTIEDWAFNDCDSLAAVVIPDEVSSIGSFSFFSTPVRYATIGSKGAKALSRAGYTFMLQGNPNIQLQYIDDSSGGAALQAEAMNRDIMEAVIPEQVTILKAGAFSGCINLTSVIIPGSIAAVGENDFLGCENLTDVILESGVEQIQDYAFHDCYSLMTVQIPNSVTSIVGKPFPTGSETLVVGCRSAARTWAEQNLYSEEGTGFPCYRIFHETVTDEAVAATCEGTGLTEGSHCTVCNEIFTPQETVEVLGHDWAEPIYDWPEEHLTVSARRICNRDETHRETEEVPATAQITLSPSDTTAGQRTYTSAPFENEAFTVQQVNIDDLPALNTLNMLKLPNSTLIIEDEAFEGGAFQGVIVPDSCTTIGSKAFANCENLLYVYIPASVTEIADDAFENSRRAAIDRK